MLLQYAHKDYLHRCSKTPSISYFRAWLKLWLDIIFFVPLIFFFFFLPLYISLKLKQSFDLQCHKHSRSCKSSESMQCECSWAVWKVVCLHCAFAALPCVARVCYLLLIFAVESWCITGNVMSCSHFILCKGNDINLCPFE